jgi:hypothetical protein
MITMPQAMHAAEKAGFLPWTRDPAAFDLEAYQHYEQVCDPTPPPSTLCLDSAQHADAKPEH